VERRFFEVFEFLGREMRETSFFFHFLSFDLTFFFFFFFLSERERERATTRTNVVFFTKFLKQEEKKRQIKEKRLSGF
jgi:hypothetical protein